MATPKWCYGMDIGTSLWTLQNEQAHSEGVSHLIVITGGKPTQGGTLRILEGGKRICWVEDKSKEEN